MPTGMVPGGPFGGGPLPPSVNEEPTMSRARGPQPIEEPGMEELDMMMCGTPAPFDPYLCEEQFPRQESDETSLIQVSGVEIAIIS